MAHIPQQQTRQAYLRKHKAAVSDGEYNVDHDDSSDPTILRGLDSHRCHYHMARLLLCEARRYQRTHPGNNWHLDLCNTEKNLLPVLLSDVELLMTDQSRDHYRHVMQQLSSLSPFST